MDDKPFQPNDIAIIFRPSLVDNEEWDGEYQVLISVVGPVTMKQEDFDKMMSVASVVSSTVHLMETDEEMCEAILENYRKFFEEGDNEMLSTSEDYKEDFILKEDTETYGGKQ